MPKQEHNELVNVSGKGETKGKCVEVFKSVEVTGLISSRQIILTELVSVD